MKKYINKKIEHLRKQPRHVRLRVALQMAIVLSIFMAILWGSVFLPLQLYVARNRGANTSGEVAGVMSTIRGMFQSVGDDFRHGAEEENGDAAEHVIPTPSPESLQDVFEHREEGEYAESYDNNNEVE